MDVLILIKGFVVGFTIAASIGPIGVLCIKRSLSNGFLAGFSSGMGVATADGTYGAVAAFGLTLVSSLLIRQEMGLQILGGVFLLYLGVKILAEKREDPEKAKSKGALKNYLSMFALTIVNPMTILMFTAAFASFGDTLLQNSFTLAATLTLGVFTGSATLYLILSIVFGTFHKKLNPRAINFVSKVSGLIIIAFSFVILASLVKSFY